MELGGIQYIHHNSRSNQFRVWAVADIHLGNAGCNKERLMEDIDSIASDPNSYWTGIGDFADYIVPGDKRFDADCIPDDIKPRDMARYGHYIKHEVLKLFKPIKHKCLGLGFGNHEKSYFIGKNQEDIHTWLCQELEVPNFGYCAFYDVQFLRGKGGTSKLVRGGSPTGRNGAARCRKRFFQHHGAGHAVTPGGKLNKLLQFMYGFGPADVYFIGHVHDQTVKRLDVLGANDTCVAHKVHKRIGLITGGYLEAYTQGRTSYAERAGYLPTVLGSVYVVIDPETGDMRASV